MKSEKRGPRPCRGGPGKKDYAGLCPHSRRAAGPPAAGHRGSAPTLSGPRDTPARHGGRRDPVGEKRKLPDSVGALADAIFARVDPEEIAVELLGEAGDKRVKTQVLTLLLAYKFGKPAHRRRVEASGPGGGPVRVVWDIPRPAREAKGLSAQEDGGLA